MSKPRSQAELVADFSEFLKFLGCTEEQYNAGARQADATWWEDAMPRYQDERDGNGLYILDDHQGRYTRREGNVKENK